MLIIHFFLIPLFLSTAALGAAVPTPRLASRNRLSTDGSAALDTRAYNYPDSYPGYGTPITASNEAGQTLARPDCDEETQNYHQPYYQPSNPSDTPGNAHLGIQAQGVHGYGHSFGQDGQSLQPGYSSYSSSHQLLLDPYGAAPLDGCLQNDGRMNGHLGSFGYYGRGEGSSTAVTAGASQPMGWNAGSSTSPHVQLNPREFPKPLRGISCKPIPGQEYLLPFLEGRAQDTLMVFLGVSLISPVDHVMVAALIETADPASPYNSVPMKNSRLNFVCPEPMDFVFWDRRDWVWQGYDVSATTAVLQGIPSDSPGYFFLKESNGSLHFKADLNMARRRQ